jgi:hypothetical protein
MPPSTYRTHLLGKTLGEQIDLPPTFTAKWRTAMANFRGPPSTFQQLADLTNAMREGADLKMPEAFVAPPPAALAPPPAPRRGRRVQHDWVAHNREAERFSAAYRHASGELPSKGTLLDHMCRWWKKRQRTLAVRKVIARNLSRRLYSDEEPSSP